MRTRIHIHREQIISTGETRHFIVRLPPDVNKVIALKVTATPVTASRPYHYEVGKLRMIHEGFLLYDVQVRDVDFEVGNFFNPVVGSVEPDREVFVSGRKNGWFEIEIPSGLTAILCKYENDVNLSNYVLAIYFEYEPK